MNLAFVMHRYFGLYVLQIYALFSMNRPKISFLALSVMRSVVTFARMVMSVLHCGPCVDYM